MLRLYNGSAACCSKCAFPLGTDTNQQEETQASSKLSHELCRLGLASLPRPAGHAPHTRAMRSPAELYDTQLSANSQSVADSRVQEYMALALCSMHARSMRLIS